MGAVAIRVAVAVIRVGPGPPSRPKGVRVRVGVRARGGVESAWEYGVARGVRSREPESASPIRGPKSESRSWLARAVEGAILRADVAAGQRSEKDLTNKIFFMRHPGRRGTRIEKGETELAREWVEIRDRQVVPALLAGPRIGPIHDPAQIPPGPDLRRGVPPDAQLSPLSITLRGLRRSPQRQPGSIAAVVVHTTSRGPAGRSKASGYRVPAVKYALDHYIDGREGYPHYVIDLNGTIYATCDERFSAAHAGWVHAGGAATFRSGWTPPQWWSSVWSRFGATTPLDLLPAGARSPNSRTIGVELLILPNLAYTAEQYRSLARLIVDLPRRHPDLRIPSAPSRGLLGHEDVTPLTGESGREDARGGWDPGLTAATPTSTGTRSGPRSRRSRRGSGSGGRRRRRGRWAPQSSMAESAPAAGIEPQAEGLADPETSVLPKETEETSFAPPFRPRGVHAVADRPALKIPPLAGLPA